jgi:hypothetical protein
MTGPALRKMLEDLHEHPSLPADDRIALDPAFKLLGLNEAIPLPQRIIDHVSRLHVQFCSPSRTASGAA